jgi:hypothetical protein
MIKVSSYLEIENVKVDLLPFKLMDDDNAKQLLTQLAAVGKASYTSVFEEFGMDFAKEQEKIMEESVELAKGQIETQYEIEQAQFLAGKKKTDDMNENEGYKTALQKAQEMAEQLLGADDGTQRSFMTKLKTSDYGQWLMVGRIIEEQKRSQQQQDQQNAQQIGQQAQQNGDTGQTPNAPDPGTGQTQ